MHAILIFCQVAVIFSIKGIIIGAAVALMILIALFRLFGRYKEVKKYTPPPPFEPPPAELYVANLGGNNILGFERLASGTVKSIPKRIIQGPNTGLNKPFDIAIDGSNYIWVTNLGNPPDSNPFITVFAPDANGNANPVHTINLGSNSPVSLARRKSTGSFMVAMDNTNTIIECAMTSPNPGAVIIGPQTELVSPSGIAVNTTQQIFVAVPSAPESGAILIYTVAPGSSTSSAPGSRIVGDNTRLNNPAHISFDTAGNLYVVNRGTPDSGQRITVYTSGEMGNILPLRIIEGSATLLNELSNPYGITIDVDLRLYVSILNKVLIYQPGAHGNAAPYYILENTDTVYLNNPIGLAVR